jgi:hypothetical protein
MQTTQLDANVESPTPSTTPRSSTGDLSTRAAGWGALTFAIVVIIQNLIRGASAPGNGASSAQLLSHYSGESAITFVLVATYVVSGIGLVVFLGGITRHLLATRRPGWALTGVLGAIGIMIIFSLVVAAEQSLTVAAHMHHPDLGAIQAIWALHNSIFSILDFSIAVALLGLSKATIAAGMTPKVFTKLAPAGAAMLVVSTVAGPAIAGGHAMALFGVGGLGFLIWLAFMITTGVRLVRTTERA